MLSQRHGLAGPDEMTLEECGPQGCGYQKFSNFKFLIAVCIIYAVFSLVVMAAYLLIKEQFRRGEALEVSPQLVSWLVMWSCAHPRP